MGARQPHASADEIAGVAAIHEVTTISTATILLRIFCSSLDFD
jgi:hypothetical protein